MLKLVIANKLYSSWSLRPWLVMRAFAIPFEELVIPLRTPESRGRVLEVSPSGKVPALIDGDMTIWDSLAIIEYLADANPSLQIWPRERMARAHARSISCEMHSGFQALRQACPMNLGTKFATPEIGEAVKLNVERIEAIWDEARSRFAGSGPYLYGEFSAADAMYAPIVTRLETYSMPVGKQTRAYMETVLAHPELMAWREAALIEPWTIADYDNGHTAIATYR